MSNNPHASNDILDVHMQSNDAGAATIRDYLVKLLLVAWEEKKPFGNGGWHFELYEALGRAGVIDITLDEDGYLEQCDTERGEQLMLLAIRAMGGAA